MITAFGTEGLRLDELVDRACRPMRSMPPASGHTRIDPIGHVVSASVVTSSTQLNVVPTEAFDGS